jgi:hypothetical protein
MTSVPLAFLVLAAAAPPPCPVPFDDVAARAGIAYTHERDATPQHRLPETMGSGLAWLDYDNDGWMDLYVVQSGKFPTGAPGRLYHNNRDGTFADVTAKSGLTTPVYGMGAAAADFDNDGWPDLYVTGFGGNVLYRNNGDGTFSDVTEKAGVRGGGWSTSAAWADFDGGGLLDLVVARYVDTAAEGTFFCGDSSTQRRDYCDPRLYPPMTPLLFHNEGGGKFADISADSGLDRTRGKGLGVVVSDLDADGRPDIYIACDTTMNLLLHNAGKNRFEDVSLLSGAGVNANGRPQGGMGVDAGDLDGDGKIDIGVANFEAEINSAFMNVGSGLFEDRSAATGFGGPSFTYSGFGLNFLDAGNRGALDAFIANGHVLDVPKISPDMRAERPFLMGNDGAGHFRELDCGEAFRRRYVARGSAVADYDNDGFPDIAMSTSGAPLVLLHNGGNGNAWTGVRLIGTKSNREGIGARLTLVTNRGRQVREVKAGGSYLSTSDPRVIFGLGKGASIDRLEIDWPSGLRQVVTNLPAGRYTVVREKGGTAPLR